MGTVGDPVTIISHIPNTHLFLSVTTKIGPPPRLKFSPRHRLKDQIVLLYVTDQFVFFPSIPDPHRRKAPRNFVTTLFSFICNPSGSLHDEHLQKYTPRKSSKLVLIGRGHRGSLSTPASY